VFSLLTKRAGHIEVTGACASTGRQDRVRGKRAGPIKMRAMIDFLGLERCLDLILVQISEQGKRGCEVVVIRPKGTNHRHTEQFIIQIGQSEDGGTRFFDPGHGLLDSGSQDSEGLLRGLPDAEELIIGHKTSCRLLLNTEGLQGSPSGAGVILVLPDVYSLLWHNVEHDFTSSPVLLDIPGILLSSSSSWTLLLAIHQSPEALGVQQSLHFLAPCDIVGASKGLDAIRLVFRGHRV